MTPTRSILICTTDRSGSGLLGDALWNTGLAGQPDEYFGNGTSRDLMEEWGTASDADYFAAVLDKTTSGNGVFVVTIHWDHLDRFQRIGRSIAEHAGGEPGDLMAAVFPAPSFVWLTREDEVRRGVSLYRADLTGVFTLRSTDPPDKNTVAPDSVPFEFDEISRRIERARAADSGWKRFFDSQNIEPLRLVYERDLSNGIDDTIRRVLSFAGIDAPPDLRVETERIKQADAYSETMVRRYRELDRSAWKRVLWKISRRIR